MRKLTVTLLCLFLFAVVGCSKEGAKTEKPKEYAPPPAPGDFQPSSSSAGGATTTADPAK